MENFKWYSFNLFILPNYTNEFIVLINDFSNINYKKGIIYKYFYLRYRDKTGYHIRYRVLAKNDFCDKNYITLTEKYISKKSTYSINEGDFKMICSLYSPEVNRYSKYLSIELTESVFQCSSIMIAKILKQSLFITYSDLLLYAITLNYLFCTIFIKNKIELIEFLKLGYTNYFNLKERKFEKVDEGYYTNYFEVSKSLYWPTLKELNRASNYYDSLFYLFKKEIANLKEDCINELIYKKVNFEKNIFNYIPIDSYIHLNNNRLGISNEDEGYIYYVIFRFIEENDFKQY